MYEQPPTAENMPEMHQAVLDGALLRQLFDDLTNCASVQEVLVKQKATERVQEDAGWSLEEASNALVNGAVRAIQVRYIFEGDEWWDTIMALPSMQFRVVRVRHEF